MSVDLLRPRVSDLVFQLYGRPLHPELFDILAVRTVEYEDYTLTVRITRTGHVISWDNPDVHLTEVTTALDPEVPLGERRRLLCSRLRNEQTLKLACAHGVHYQTCCQIEVLTQGHFLEVHDDLVADGTKRGLLHNFSRHPRWSISPLGFVSAEARNGCLLIHAFHTFPDEHTVVKTQTLIERA